MKDRENIVIRLTESREAQLRAICRALGVDPDGWGAYSQALDYALARCVNDDKLFEKGENEMDRVSQINWLRELAGNITANLGWGTAEELVEYALSDEGRDDWGIEIPEWFDDHDRASLVRFVAESL